MKRDASDRKKSPKRKSWGFHRKSTLFLGEKKEQKIKNVFFIVFFVFFFFF
tara:strand:+ start:755 stop:907 length:153 start_codon:yes stop_codon:yes gene_type:complete